MTRILILDRGMADYLCIHGGWAGGWQWSGPADLLARMGHRVFRPSLTGMGERYHLAAPETNLSLHIRDVLQVIEYEGLADFILVGFSYGGMIATGVTDRIPEKIRFLVYLDAFIPRPGESLFDIFGSKITDRLDSISESFGEGWKIPHFDTYDPRLTDQPIETGREKLAFSQASVDSVPGVYIECTRKPESWTFTPILKRIAEEYRARGGTCIPFETDHFPMHSNPRGLANLLHEIPHRGVYT